MNTRRKLKIIDLSLLIYEPWKIKLKSESQNKKYRLFFDYLDADCDQRRA